MTIRPLLRPFVPLAYRFVALIQRKVIDEIAQIKIRSTTGVILRGDVKLRGIPLIIVHPESSIEIGDRDALASRSSATDLGVSRPCLLRTLRAQAKIQIGANTGMSGAVICAADSITIGQNCLIGADVMIFDTDFHAIKPDNRRYNKNPADIAARKVEIEDNVFIGARSIVCKGVVIGTNTVIGAGSIVTSSIPPNVIAVGNPCRVIRPLDN